MLQKKQIDWGLCTFLPALFSFIREIHRGCGGIEEIHQKKRKKERCINIF
jgi:hypothetical protein